MKGKLRNRLCSCGSGLKYKKCCLAKEQELLWTENSERELNKDYDYAKKRYEECRNEQRRHDEVG